MATIVIGFKQDFDESSKVIINLETSIPEHEHIWIWDHFFSLVLHRLSANKENAQLLLDQMSEWAVGFANKMYSPINELHAEGALQIDKSIHVDSSASNLTEALDEIILIEATGEEGAWPTVHTKISDDTSAEKLLSAVIALGHYFLSNNTNFFRELPMHVLGMRKFYADEMSFADEESISEAPAYSFNLALKFYQGLDEKMKRE